MGGDRLSRSLIRFKEALAFDLPAWIDCAISELKGVNMPSDVIIMRALGNEETIINSYADTALDKLGKAIAQGFKISWSPGLIGKFKQTRPLKLLVAAERRAEMKNVYYLFPQNMDLTNKRILLIDDIVTTGTTVTSIIKLIKEHFPGARIKVFTLAKSDYDSSLNASLQLTGGSYAWEGNTGWMVAESEAEYYSYKQLSASILNDDFS